MQLLVALGFGAEGLQSIIKTVYYLHVGASGSHV